jgi:hypothetical protein
MIKDLTMGGIFMDSELYTDSAVGIIIFLACSNDSSSLSCAFAGLVYDCAEVVMTRDVHKSSKNERRIIEG